MAEYNFLQLLSTALVSLIVSASTLHAEELNITKTIYLEKGSLLNTKAIVHSHDNDLVIVGAIRTTTAPFDEQPWATKIDKEGNLKWRYVRQADARKAHAISPYYSSVAVMSDDSVFLCGSISGSGLLTHLDKDGKVLSEQTFKPEGFKAGDFKSCTAANDGIIIVGGTGSLDSATRVLHLSYWILYLNNNGKEVWSKTFPTPDKFSRLDEVSPIQVLNDGSFVFAARRILNAEEMHISSQGELLASSVFDGITGFILPANVSGYIQLFVGDGKSVGRLQLNEKLQENTRVIAKETPDISYLHQAYYLPDNSLMLFGSSSIHPAHARILKLDSALKQEQILNIEPLRSSDSIELAVPLEKAGEFAAVRRTRTPVTLHPINSTKLVSQPNEKQASADIKQDENTGLAIDFIQFK